MTKKGSFYNALGRYLIYRRIEQMHSGRDISYEEWRSIDLAYPQAPIDWQSITGGITRSTSIEINSDQYITESDVILIR